MAATSVGLGWLEVLLILIGGGGLLGMPPGARDVDLLKAAPQQCMVYMEWAARGPGKAGAPGIDGFVADPEILALFGAIDKALATPDKPGVDQEPQPQSLDAIRFVKLATAHSGCLFALMEPPQPGKGLLSVPTPAEILSGLRACLIINAGSDAKAIIESLNGLSHEAIPLQPKMHEIQGQMGLMFTVHQEGDRLFLAVGAGTIERARSGLSGATPGLNSNPRFQTGWKRVESARMGTVGWVDLKGVTDFAIRAMGPAGMVAQVAMRGAGVDALDFVVSGSGVVDGQVIQRSFVATAGRTDGVMLVAKSPALRLEQLAHIPADSDLVLAASLDLGQFVAGIRELVAKTNPLSVRVFDEATRELEKELGLNLGKDVYPAFGNSWTAFSAPSEGGLLGSGLIVAIEVRDTAKAQAIFDRLMQTLEQSLAVDADPEYGGVTAELKQQEFLGHTIKYVRSSGLSFDTSPAMIPSFCMNRSHLMFAVHPQALKAHLRYLESRRPGFDTVAKTKLSLAKEELLLAGYFDGPRAIQVLSGLVPFMGRAMAEMAHGNGWEFDAFSIPSTAALVPYSGDVTFSFARQKDGLLIESKNPQIGMALMAALGWARFTLHHDYQMLLETKRQNHRAVENAGLGAPDGKVIPAAAEKLAPVPQEKPADVAARRAAPIFIRAFVPDGVQPLIPDEVFRKLAEPPSPEVLKQREERRKLNEERRRQRLERRGVPQKQ